MKEFSQKYLDAKKAGLRNYSKNISEGNTGYLPFLDGILKNIDIVSEIDLGIVEVPLKQVVGTYTYMRSITFSHNFMPLMDEQSEFGQKWENVYKAHVNEGIRDPIKVYEYMNWFYVVEGNKRVSVLKYFDVYSVSAYVTRLIPKKDEEDINNNIYYEFMDFYKKTHINNIWFSNTHSFNELFHYIEKFDTSDMNIDDKYSYISKSIYLYFRKIYMECGGGQLPITTGDAFLEYIKIYGLSQKILEVDLKKQLKLFLKELEYFKEDSVEVQTSPDMQGDRKIISKITTLLTPKNKLKVAFVYAKNLNDSSWSYAHEMGRLHIENIFKEQISTSYIEDVPESLDAYKSLRKLAKERNDIIFTTSPSFINATLKIALEYPNIKFFNCSGNHTFKHVNTYFGRMYEPRFLAGIIAGVLTRTDIIGYVGTYPIPEVISGINAFALGANMVNPRVKVKVEWTNDWDCKEMSQSASNKLMKAGTDIISHHNTLPNKKFSREYGVYSALCNIDDPECNTREYIAAPLWNWGIFYEKIIRNFLTDSWRVLTEKSKLINFWWGMDSGILDFIYSKSVVPRETQKLLEQMKKMIISSFYSPFTGPIFDQTGTKRIEDDIVATLDEIHNMDWFVDNVEGILPERKHKKGDSTLITGKI